MRILQGGERADYVLALKANQGNLLEDVRLYFSEDEFLKKCAYKRTVEKARGKTEKREYWQTDDISWLRQKKEWAGLKTIILTRNTVIGKEGESSTEERYFISSLPTGIEEAARAVRGHWMVESYHWHLDVTFREDGNHTIEKQAAYNLNIMRKLSLNILKLTVITQDKEIQTNVRKEKILDTSFLFVYDSQSEATKEMEKIVEQGLLYDFYGELLNEHQRQIYEDVVFHDMSLSEIAQEQGISRQGVHDLIRRCDRTLLSYEAKLHLLEKFERVKEKVARIEQISGEEAVKTLAAQILEEM